MADFTVSCLISSLTTIEGVVWRQCDYDASKMKKFIKGDEVKGYVDIRVGGKLTRYVNSDREAFCDVIARVMASKIGKMGGDITLIPIPNSIATVSHKPVYNTLALAQAIVSHLKSGCAFYDALRWKTMSVSSHKGGSRDPVILYDNLELIGKPRGAIVLLDDVMTTGAHMIACARKIRDAGFTVDRGIVAIRATYEQRDNVVGWFDEEIDIGSNEASYVF